MGLPLWYKDLHIFFQTPYICPFACTPDLLVLSIPIFSVSRPSTIQLGLNTFSLHPHLCPLFGIAELVLQVWNISLCGSQWRAVTWPHIRGNLSCPRYQWIFLCYSSMCVLWYLANPRSLSALEPCTWGREHFAWSTRQVHVAYHPPQQLGRTSWSGEMHTGPILLSLFLLWVKHYSNQRLVCWILLADCIRGSECRLWAPASGGWHCYDLCCLPCGGNPHLGLVVKFKCSTCMELRGILMLLKH